MFRTTLVILSLGYMVACSGTSEVSGISGNPEEGIQTKLINLGVYEPLSTNNCETLKPFSQSVLLALKIKLPNGDGGGTRGLKVAVGEDSSYSSPDGGGTKFTSDYSVQTALFTPSSHAAELSFSEEVIGGCNSYVIEINGICSNDCSSLLINNQEQESSVSVESDGTFNMVFSVSSLEQLVELTPINSVGDLLIEQTSVLNFQIQ